MLQVHLQVRILVQHHTPKLAVKLVGGEREALVCPHGFDLEGLVITLCHKLVCNVTAGFFDVIDILFNFYCFGEGHNAEHMGKSVFYLFDFGLIVAVVMEVEAA